MVPFTNIGHASLTFEYITMEFVGHKTSILVCQMDETMYKTPLWMDDHLMEKLLIMILNMGYVLGISYDS